MKKAIALLLVIALTAAVAVGGTLAYLTDRENETNVFTMGDVKIELDNQFAQGIELAPGVPVDNTITITNTGKNDAWVWYAVKFDKCDSSVIDVGNIGAEWTQQVSPEYGNVQLLKAPLAAGKSETVDMKIALDPTVDIAPDGKLYKVVGGNVTELDWNISAGNPVAYINAYAIQTDTFNTVEAAYAAYIAQWGGLNGTQATVVANAAELGEALAEGGEICLANDVSLDVNGMALTVAADKKVVIDLNGNDIIATTTASGASQVLFEVKGELTIEGNGTIAMHDKSNAGFNPAYENAAVYVNGGVANLNGGSIICTSSGSAMAYAADAVGGNSVININGATLYSSYIGVRSFTTASGKTNTINYNSGVVYGAKNGYDIWVQEDSVGTTDVNIADGITYTERAEFGTMYYIDEAAAVVATSEGLAAAMTEGGNITLATDVFVDSKLEIASGKNVTLDLNGNELSGAFTQKGVSALIQNKGTLTITNGTVTSLAENPDTDWNPEGFPTYASNTISNSGTLVIGEGVVIENQTNVGGASYAIDNYAGANLTINGGVIKAKDVAIRINTASTSAANNVTINGGEITGKHAIWIHIAGSNAAQAPAVNLKITGGDFNSTSDLTIYSYSYGQSFANVKVEISGGDFEKDVAFGGGYKGDQETVTVTGGTFNRKLGRYLENDGWVDIAKP